MRWRSWCPRPHPRARTGGRPRGEGYDLPGWGGESDVSYLPDASVSLVKGSRCVQAASTTDVRALTGPDARRARRPATAIPKKLQVKLTFNAAYTGNLRLYAVDWGGTGAKEAESITVGSSNSVGFATTSTWVAVVSVKANGRSSRSTSRRWSLTITVTDLAGSSAVLSGMFLGDAGAPPGPTVSSAPQGTWAGAVGSAGYDLADWDGAGDVSYMPGASINLLQGSRYEWAQNTTDTRVLSDPGEHARNAAPTTTPTNSSCR